MTIYGQSGFRREDFLGFPFDNAEFEDLKKALLDESRQPFGYLVTPNVLHIVRAEKDKRLSGVLKNAKYSVCDSQVLRLLARLRGISLQLGRGSDFVRYLMENPTRQNGEKISFGVIGSNREQIRKLASEMGVLVAAHHVPPMGFIEMPDEVLKAALYIQENQVDIWLLAVGMPQQEFLADMVSNEMDCMGTALCVGASLDFLTGVEKRAPGWMASIGLEWLWRLLSDPFGKWRRYIVESPRIFWLVIKDWFGFLNSGKDTGSRIT